MKRALLTACLWSASTSTASRPETGLFTEITASAGIDFVHDPGDGGEGRYLLPEIMGPGAAFLDYDSDGDLDIYLLQGAAVKPNRLFRQNADGTFEDQTEASGLGDRGYGMGVAVGDVDNDDLVDVYVTNYGPDALYRNLGKGRFEDVTSRAGIGGDAWSASAVFCDYDRDGFLDLYVTHYVRYDAEEVCTQADGSRDYCAPAVFPGTPDTLYRNTGRGGFEDVSSRAGIDGVRARGLGVVCADFDDDGFFDFYVANDGEANQLWTNQGDGTFVDEAFLAGAALSAMGRPQAGMGIAIGDVDGDSDHDLFLTHIADEKNTLYVRDGAGFEDRTTAWGLAGPSLGLTGFGTVLHAHELDEDASLCYEAALGLDPESGRWRYLLARTLEHRDPERALALAREALETMPDFLPAQVLVGELEEQAGRYDLALAAYRAAAMMDDTAAVAELGMGCVLVREGELREGLPHLKRAAELDPEAGANSSGARTDLPARRQAR